MEKHKLQGYINVFGLRIAVENRKGSIRRGSDDDGNVWETRMFYPYGYFVGTEGTDGDPVDCFVGDDRESRKVYIIHINDPESKKYDEDKVMIGFGDEKSARDAFLAHYDRPHKFLRDITEMDIDDFKKKLKSREGKMIKAFGKKLMFFLKAVSLKDLTQIDLFEPKEEVITGKTVVRDGKTYQYKRSKKNPSVNRLMRIDEEEEQEYDLFSKPKENKKKPSLFGGQISLFDKQKEEPKPDKPPTKQTSKEEQKVPSKPKNIGAEGFEGGKEKRRKQRIELNNKVREILSTKTDDEITEADKEALRAYSGRGGTDKASLNEYYTLSFAASFMWEKLRDFGFRGGRVLEPSAGTGMFLETAPDDALVSAVEIDETSGRILQILHGDEHECEIKSFEEYNRDNEGGEFAAVIGNCPFGVRGATVRFDPQLKHIDKHEQYFVQRGIDALEDNGIMAMIVPTGVMDNQWNDWRLEINKEAEFLGAIRMPTGAFDHAHATVTTDIVFFRKREEMVRDVLHNLDDKGLGRMYDEGIIDAEFVAGNYFENNPQYALGRKTKGNFDRDIWVGELVESELREVGDILKNYVDILPDDFKAGELPTPQVGDTKVINGRTYRLNANHRWERVRDGEDEEAAELPEELQQLFNIKTYAELDEIRNDPSKVIELTREQIAGLEDRKLTEELSSYKSSKDFENDMLKRAVVLGFELKQLAKDLQNNRLSTTEAQGKTQQLMELLENFKNEVGDPAKELGLSRYIGKTEANPILYFVSAFTKDGFSKLLTDPIGYYKFYNPNAEIGKYDESDLLSISQYLVDNGLDTGIENIAAYYAETDNIEELEKLLIENKDIFIDEHGGFSPVQEATVGDVVPKLEAWAGMIGECKEILGNESISERDRYIARTKMEKLNDQIDELKDRAGFKEIDNLPISLIDAKGLLDVDILNNYLTDFLGSYWQGELMYSPETNFFIPTGLLGEAYTLYIQKGGSGEAKMSGSDKARLQDLMKKFFNEDNPIMFSILNRLNSLPINIRDKSRLERLEETYSRLESNFKNYLASLENADEIRETFNRAYYSYVHKQYDSSPIEGLSKFAYDKVVAKVKDKKTGEIREITARDKAGEHTWATVRRMYDQGKGLIAHGVGLGKTLQGLILALSAKETGRAKKPLIVTPKSVLKNWVAEINKWTEGVNYIVVGSKEVMDGDGRTVWKQENKNEIEEKLKMIESNDYDMVLMSRDTFSRIDFTEATKKRLIDEVTKKYYPGDPSEMDKKMLKKYENMQKTVSKVMTMTNEKGKYAGFEGTKLESLGFDMIIRDESHDVKNLLLSLQDNVSGLSSAMSQRALHNFLASKVVFETAGNKGYYGLTATPISNSPLEVFNMLLPFAEKELDALNIVNLDKFVDTFAHITTVTTAEPDGRVVNKNKFAGWKNPEALRKLFFRFIDYKTAKDVESVKANIKFPDENPNHIFTEMNEGQKELLRHCKTRLYAQRYKIWDKDSKSWELNTARMDNDLADGIITDEIRNRVEEYFHNEYLPMFIRLNAGKNPDEKFDDDGYFQVQSDLVKISTDLAWYKDSPSRYAKKVEDGFVELYSNNDKMNKLIENAVGINKSGGKQLIFAINKNLHNKIKDRLIESGIKPEEIAIVNADMTPDSDQRVRVSNDFNEGKYKVVIGNYATMGEGLNFQKMTEAIHHMQPTWNYLQIEQGNGRAIRQGNDLEKVNTFYYLARGSIDNFMNTKIQEKGGMVDKFMRGELSTWDDDVNMSLAEMMIELADNPEEARRLLENEQKRIDFEVKKQKTIREFRELERYYDTLALAEKIEDRESRRYKRVEKELKEIKSGLSESEHSEIYSNLDSKQRPLILKENQVVIPIGTVLKAVDGGGEDGYWKIESYTPSTQRVVVRRYGKSRGYNDTKISIMRPDQFDNHYNKIFTKAGIDSNKMYENLLEAGVSETQFLYQLPGEVIEKNKDKVVELLNDGYGSVLVKDFDGNVRLLSSWDKNKFFSETGGKYFFPSQDNVYMLKLYTELKKQKPSIREGTEEGRIARAVFGSSYLTGLREHLKSVLGDKFLSDLNVNTEEEDDD